MTDSDMIEVLVVDDDAGIRFFLTETLEQAGYNVTTADRGGDALDKLRDTPFDLVFLDLNLGGKTDGLRVLEMAKWRWSQIAVVIFTAHGTMDSALTAIQEGVEGYLLKPATPAEVRDAAQKALSRRKATINESKPKESVRTLEHGKLFLDLDKHLATLDENPIELTSSEFRLMAHFMENTQRVSTPRELVKIARDYDCTDDREAREIIKWYIHRLRQKTEVGSSAPEYIVNIRGVGYRLGENS